MNGFEKEVHFRQNRCNGGVNRLQNSIPEALSEHVLPQGLRRKR